MDSGLFGVLRCIVKLILTCKEHGLSHCHILESPIGLNDLLDR